MNNSFLLIINEWVSHLIFYSYIHPDYQTLRNQAFVQEFFKGNLSCSVVEFCVQVNSIENK